MESGRTKARKFICLLTISAMIFNPFSTLVAAVLPTTAELPSSDPICSGGSQTIPVSITLPPSAISEKVDIFFSFDDTGSFADFVPTVTSIFGGLVESLETSLPDVDFGFGVGRFEDYGGSGSSFSEEVLNGRPFILNQPVITVAGAGSAAARDTLISQALSRSAPGFGGDIPESSIAEGLYQIATGIGFDGDGNGSSLDSGNAGDIDTQTNPGNSGDVPPFSSNLAPTSGSLGGVGWRADALHLVVLATDTCPVAPFPAGNPIPDSITGAGGVSEPVSVFACSSTTPGIDRFGFVGDSKSLSTNSVAGAVVPSEAGTVQATVSALNDLGIRVIGMGPDAGPTDSIGPSFDESVFLSGLARLTGALDSTGAPLVFSTSVPLSELNSAIADAIAITATLPVDITVSTSELPEGLSVAATPSMVAGVAPGGTADFTLELSGNGHPISGSFDVFFTDLASGAVLGTLPVTVDCKSSADLNPPSCTVGPTLNGVVTVTVQDTESGLASVTPVTVDNATVTIPSFVPGTQDAVDISVTQKKRKLSSNAQISVSDLAGNSVECDSVSILAVSRPGKPGSHSYGGVSHKKHHAKIISIGHGVRKVLVIVDGRIFRFKSLRKGTSIAISKAYKSKYDNSVKIEVYGDKGAWASVALTE